MIDRLAELCDRVAEIEAENARLVQELKSAHEVLADCGDQSQALAATVAQLREALDLGPALIDELGWKKRTWEPKGRAPR